MSSSPNIEICCFIISLQRLLEAKRSSLVFFQWSTLPLKLLPMDVCRWILCLGEREIPNRSRCVKSWVFAPLWRRITEIWLIRADTLWFLEPAVTNVARAIALQAFCSSSQHLWTPQSPSKLACQNGHITFVSCLTNLLEYAGVLPVKCTSELSLFLHSTV